MKFFKIFSMTLACIVIFSACAKNIKKENNSAQGVQASAPNLGETDSAYIIELKKAIVSALNNDIWFNDIYSQFFTMAQQSYEIEIYKNDKLPGMVSVIFNKKIIGSNYFNNDENYFAVHFWKGDRGYSSEYAGAMWESDLEKLRTRLKELGYYFYRKSKISFEKTKQPTYNPLSSENKDSIVKDIENVVTKNLIDWKKEGNYKIYIRDFSENDYKTYVVVEDKCSTNAWIYNVGLDNNWHVCPSKFTEVNLDSLKYIENQYKKVSILEKDLDLSNKIITNKQQSESQSQGNLSYTNSKLGFTLTFPES